MIVMKMIIRLLVRVFQQDEIDLLIIIVSLEYKGSSIEEDCNSLLVSSSFLETDL